MAPKCSVRGCPIPADFGVYLFDHNQITSSKCDEDVPYLCLPHAELNEVNAERPQERDVTYPFTKKSQAYGYTVYALLKAASPAARFHDQFMPRKPEPGEPRPAQLGSLRRAFEAHAGPLPVVPCSFDDCPFPADFEVWTLDDRGFIPHPVGRICQDHAVAVAKEYPFATAKGRLFIFLPAIEGKMRAPKELEGRTFEFDELTSELRETLQHVLHDTAA